MSFVQFWPVLTGFNRFKPPVPVKTSFDRSKPNPDSHPNISRFTVAWQSLVVARGDWGYNVNSHTNY